jgi:serine phosphatase RsbU (regulator of sigma subunit)
MVGGDIYDFVLLPDGRLAVLFGDASGHGWRRGW